MALIPQTKCSNCDKLFSGLRSRCPFCGARRHKRGKRAVDSDNATWKIVIGVLLVVVLIAAVVVLLVTVNNEDDEGDDGISQSGTPGGIIDPNDITVVPGDDTGNDDGSGDNGNTDGEVGGEPGGDDTQNEPEETPAKSAKLTRNDGSEFLFEDSSTKERYDMTLKTNDDQVCVLRVTPEDATSIPTWSSSNTEIFDVVPSASDETGRTATITALKAGKAYLTVTIDDVVVECIVRVKQK